MVFWVFGFVVDCNVVGLLDFVVLIAECFFTVFVDCFAWVVRLVLSRLLGVFWNLRLGWV